MLVSERRGPIGEMEHAVLYRGVRQTTAWYREFAPCPALRAHVYAFFSFVPGPVQGPVYRPLIREIAFDDPTFGSPQFADGGISLVLELGRRCDIDGRWHIDSGALGGTVIGPMHGVGRIEGSDRSEMVGAYFRPARAAPFFRVAIADLTDRAVAINDLWGAVGSRLASDLCELDETARIDRLESLLLSELRRRPEEAHALDINRLAASVLRQHGRVTVAAMARAAGVSRQHLSRSFRERIGVGPKVFSRLARFQSGLVYAGAGRRMDWAQAAARLGYADQSHMIAEFRQFSGLTPHALSSRNWFHPFIERAKSSADRERSASRAAAIERLMRTTRGAR